MTNQDVDGEPTASAFYDAESPPFTELPEKPKRPPQATPAPVEAGPSASHGMQMRVGAAVAAVLVALLLLRRRRGRGHGGGRGRARRT